MSKPIHEIKNQEDEIDSDENAPPSLQINKTISLSSK